MMYERQFTKSKLQYLADKLAGRTITKPKMVFCEADVNRAADILLRLKAEPSYEIVSVKPKPRVIEI